MDHPVDGIPHRRAENFTVGDIVRAGTRYRRQSFDRECQIGVSGAEQADFIGFFHQGFQALHFSAHFVVIDFTAGVEEEILESFEGHFCFLRVGIGREPAHHPPGVGDAFLQVNRQHPQLFIFAHLIAGNVGEFFVIQYTSDGNVTVHLFHAV